MSGPKEAAEAASSMPRPMQSGDAINMAPMTNQKHALHRGDFEYDQGALEGVSMQGDASHRELKSRQNGSKMRADFTQNFTDEKIVRRPSFREGDSMK